MSQDFKEACRLFWMVKGHLGASDDAILASADSYFRRLWGNCENYYKEEGFEEAYQKKLDNSK